MIPSTFWDKLRQDRFTPRLGTYHVTTLTSCLAKVYFERTRSSEDSVESAWAKLRGSLIHYVTRSLGWSELRTKMTFDLDNELITIVGYVDAFDPETATIYDLKTTRFVNWQNEKGFIPRENHTAQVQCYYTMLDAYGIPVSRLVLIYVDDKNIVAKEVPLGNRKQWMIQRASSLHKALVSSELPEPEVGSGCKYCQFLKSCPKQSDAQRPGGVVR